MKASRIVSMLAIVISGIMLFVGVVEDKAAHILLPFAILAGCAVVALAISELRIND